MSHACAHTALWRWLLLSQHAVRRGVQRDDRELPLHRVTKGHRTEIVLICFWLVRNHSATTRRVGRSRSSSGFPFESRFRFDCTFTHGRMASHATLHCSDRWVAVLRDYFRNHVALASQTGSSQ